MTTENLRSELLSAWTDRLAFRPDWAKVIEIIRSWSIQEQEQLSGWVDQFRLNPNQASEAAILIDECRLQKKSNALEMLGHLDVDKGQAATAFMKALRTLRRPGLEDLREQINRLKRQLQTRSAHIQYSDDLELDEFELRVHIGSMKDWDDLSEYVSSKRAKAEALLQTIKNGHVEA
jgi:hypothetical protein